MVSEIIRRVMKSHNLACIVPFDGGHYSRLKLGTSCVYRNSICLWDLQDYRVHNKVTGFGKTEMNVST